MRIHKKQDSKRMMIAAVMVPAVLMGYGCGALNQAEQAAVDDATASATTAANAVVDDGDCCVEADPTFPRVGCEVPSIETCVCDELPECCSDNWGLQCVGAASSTCGGCSAMSDDERAIAGLLTDSDGDGRLDIDEIIAGLDPFWPYDGPDIDGDGILNGEDPDVDGDGTLNAYDRDVDGDGIRNVHDDDIDGDSLLNRLLDDDDDGDGIPDLIDNDDDADGRPDPEDFDFEEDEDPDDDNDDKDEEEVLKAVLEAVSGSPEEPLSVLVSRAMERIDELSLDFSLCQSDGDCDPGERCGPISCVEAEKLNPENDDDEDGLFNDFDIDINGDGDIDDDNDGLPDFFERALLAGFEDVTVELSADDPLFEIIQSDALITGVFTDFVIVDLNIEIVEDDPSGSFDEPDLTEDVEVILDEDGDVAPFGP